MAWNKDKARFIEFLEEAIYDLVLVRGHLETRAREGDMMAIDAAGRLKHVQQDFRRIREAQWRQIGLWPEEGDGET